MLKNILSPDTCARCKMCCTFDRYDLGNTPVIPDEMKTALSELYPSAGFVRHGESWLFRMEEEKDGAFRCPMLTPTGCMLGDSKPFDCRIWPFMLMEFRGRLVITLDPLCPVMYRMPLDRLIYELEHGLADDIFAGAEKCPDTVRPYRAGYPILSVSEQIII